MARTDAQVAKILRTIYKEEFAGKSRQRFLIAWSDLREIYGFHKFFDSRFALLREEATNQGMYLWDLGESKGGRHIAVVALRTVDRWRKAPKKIVGEYKLDTISDESTDFDEV